MRTGSFPQQVVDGNMFSLVHHTGRCQPTNWKPSRSKLCNASIRSDIQIPLRRRSFVSACQHIQERLPVRGLYQLVPTRQQRWNAMCRRGTVNPNGERQSVSTLVMVLVRVVTDWNCLQQYSLNPYSDLASTKESLGSAYKSIQERRPVRLLYQDVATTRMQCDVP